MPDAAIFAGTSNPALAGRVATELKLPLGAATVQRFEDTEVHVVLEEAVRRKSVVIVQPTSPSVDAHLLELLAFVDAARRAAAARIIAAVPYFGYARGDRRRGLRAPIMASLTARLFEAAGIDHVVAVDLHAPQIEGFFGCPVDALTAVPVLSSLIAGRLDPATVVVSPDIGRIGMAGEVADRLGLETAILQKRREDHTVTSVLALVGDVRDRPCLIVDDIVLTGDTIAAAIQTLRAAGARPPIDVAVTHCLLSAEAARRLAAAGVRQLVTTDTVCLPAIERPSLRVGSVGPLIGQALARLLA